MNEKNSSQTLSNARNRIMQLVDASDPGDLVFRYGVASGWLSALRTEGLLDDRIFDTLYGELNEVFRTVGVAIGAPTTVH